MRNRILLLLVSLLLAGCARVVVPTGGPKDVAPPVVVKELPESGSLFFQSKSIRITFDEFITLNNPSENIFFSPPLQVQPDFTTAGKSVIIRIYDTLRSNKTYNIAFSNAIKDFTEGNPLPFYQYTFSTGAYIDSFMVEGQIINAQTTAAEENVLVLLYDRNIDSLPLSAKPTYITKSQKNGLFTFRHVASGEYKIFALKDINNNLIFDLPNESIAFSDSPVTAVVMPKEKRDTLSQKQTEMVRTRQAGKPFDGIKLSLFTEEDTVQRLLKPKNPNRGIYQLIYKHPFTDFEARPLDSNTAGHTYMEYRNAAKDTVIWYFREEVRDSLFYEVTADRSIIDTAVLLPYRAAATQRGSRGARREAARKLTYTVAHAGDLYEPLTLKFSYPILPVDHFSVTVIKLKKSANDTACYHYHIPDTFVLSVPLPFPLEEKVPYLVMIKDSIFQGYDGTRNDSIEIRFNSKSEKDYGNLTMNYQVKQPGKEFIVSLLDSRDHILQTDIVSSSVQVKYFHLSPGEYRIKVIEDRNGNGKWDTGNYRKKQQPEPIFYFDKPLSIRGYWELEESFDLDIPKTDSTD